MPEELWMEVHDIVQEAVIKTVPKKKKFKKAKWLSDETLQIAEKKNRSGRQRRKGKRQKGLLLEEALQIAVKRKEVKGKGEKESYTHLNSEF